MPRGLEKEMAALRLQEKGLEWALNEQKEERRRLTKVRKWRDEIPKGHAAGKKHLEHCIEEKLKNVEKARRSSGLEKLKKAFHTAAEFHDRYCDVVDYFNLRKKWDSFLMEVCRLYDAMLVWGPMVGARVPKTKRQFDSHDGEKNNTCKFCRKKAYSFRDERKEFYYRVDVHKQRAQAFCLTRNIIYLITCKCNCKSTNCACEKCPVRYVGETEKSLSQRYSSETGYTHEVCNHFKPKTGHQKVFHILQIVDETSLFPDNESFCKYVTDNPVELDGIEHLWINQLIDKEEGDLNTQVNFEHKEKHCRHMSELLRYFICKHELVYVQV